MVVLPRLVQLVALIVILVGIAIISFLFTFPPVEIVLGKPVLVHWGMNISDIDPLIQTLIVGRYILLVEQNDDIKLYLLTQRGLQTVEVGSDQQVVAAQIELTPVMGKVQLNFNTLTYRTYSAGELVRLFHFFQPIVIESDPESDPKILFPKVE